MREYAHGNGAAAKADGDVNALSDNAEEAQQGRYAWGACGRGRVAASILRERRRGDSKDSGNGELGEHHLVNRSSS